MKVVVGCGQELKKVPLTLSVTMPLDEWETLRDQLATSWPSWQFSRAIKAALDHVVRSVDAVVATKDISEET